jgi:hypothetical protein
MIIKEKSIKSHKALERVLLYIFCKEGIGRFTFKRFISGDRLFQKQLELASGDAEASSIIMSQRLANIHDQFVSNDSLRLHKRKGETKYFHCVLSFHKADRLNEAQLLKVARQYARERFPKSLVVATSHTDTEHLHLHLVGSNVTYGLGTTCRLTKAEFQHLKQRMEQWQDRELGLSFSRIDHGKKKPLRFARMPNIRLILGGSPVKNKSSSFCSTESMALQNRRLNFTKNSVKKVSNSILEENNEELLVNESTDLRHSDIPTNVSTSSTLPKTKDNENSKDLSVTGSRAKNLNRTDNA